MKKRQCIELVNALDNVHKEMAGSLNNAKQAFPLLEACMKAALTVAEIVEGAEGTEGAEGAAAVKELEKYSDAVYSIYEDISKNKSLNSHKTEKALRKLLRGVLNKIDAVSTKSEIVFLPYKASMWDSLESVWRKADRDENCDAYVIPVPYYDRNPDGSFGSFHYEGDLYPKDVPVVDYKSYDFEGRHPDKIYFHNPYDENNFVTSVEPEFYSKNLKKYTDELVYIPYFVLGDIDPDNEEALKEIAHLITVPGVINADKVIVQSEKMRKVYIKVLSKQYGQRSVWEKKISGEGSPKLERVKNLRDEDFELPGEWLKVVNKPDGSRKKIIFYNTGLTAFLENNEKMLKKIRYILGVFNENKEDVVLLWRPHPLIEATLTSMRPHLWEDYKHIVDEYKAGSWGIFDESAELDRAIAVSDAYYGDWSSVVQLYQQTGKPVMIENVEVLME